MMELKSVGIMTFPIYGKIKNVPNHELVYGAIGLICSKIDITSKKPFPIDALVPCLSHPLKGTWFVVRNQHIHIVPDSGVSG